MTAPTFRVWPNGDGTFGVDTDPDDTAFDEFEAKLAPRYRGPFASVAAAKRAPRMAAAAMHDFIDSAKFVVLDARPDNAKEGGLFE